MGRSRQEHGQASPEWIALVCVVALTLAALLASGARIPGTHLAIVIAKRFACAVDLGEGCGGTPSDLVLAYGTELAELVSAHAPRLDYEEGMRALPVDFRSCREDACAEGREGGHVRGSLAGEPVTAFVHVIDCREAPSVQAEADCSGVRAGQVYLQYWLYYPGSDTRFWGEAGHHPDDFESFQVRIAADGRARERASSHNGYNGAWGNWLNDIEFTPKQAGWTESSGRYEISGGSHAGRVGQAARGLPRWLRRPARWTEPDAIRMVPLVALRDVWDDYDFEVTPPWEKAVFRDPEDRRT